MTLLSKISVKELADIGGCSKQYASQVKSGKRPLSDSLLKALESLHADTRQGIRLAEIQRTLDAFLASRREGISPYTIKDYRRSLGKALPVMGLTPTTAKINHYLTSLTCSLGGKFDEYKNALLLPPPPNHLTYRAGRAGIWTGRRGRVDLNLKHGNFFSIAILPQIISMSASSSVLAASVS